MTASVRLTTLRLKALAFIHSKRVAHRVRRLIISFCSPSHIISKDAFHDNFLVQLHPESMLSGKPSMSRPRVFLIDFEVAVKFAAEIPTADCTCRGLPLGGSFTQPEMYSRPVPPEIEYTDSVYCPFKLDVWQLGFSFLKFKVRFNFLY